MSQNDWYASFLLPVIKAKVEASRKDSQNPLNKSVAESFLKEVSYHVNDLASISGVRPGKWADKLNYQGFDDFTADQTIKYLDSLKTTFRLRYNNASANRDAVYNAMKARLGEERFKELQENNLNEALKTLVLNRMTTTRVYDSGKKIIQKSDPVFMLPGSKYGRSHFFAPFKQIGNLRISTILFNLIAIWIMIIGLFATLYYNVLKRFIEWLETLKIPIWRKFGRDLLQM
jgi:hypothetical protein